MAHNELLPLDLTIFVNIHGNNDLKSCSDEYDNCFVIKRLLTTLSYYSRFDIINNTNDQLIFIKFIDRFYGYKMCDDFYHLIKCHKNDIESVTDLAIGSYNLPECN